MRRFFTWLTRRQALQARLVYLEDQLAQRDKLISDNEIAHVPLERVVDWTSADAGHHGQYMRSPCGMKFKVYLEKKAVALALAASRHPAGAEQDRMLAESRAFQRLINYLHELGNCARTMQGEQVQGLTDDLLNGNHAGAVEESVRESLGSFWYR